MWRSIRDRRQHPGINLDSITGSVNGSAGSFLNKSLGSANGLVVLTAMMPTEVPLNFDSFLSLSLTPGAPTTYGAADFTHTAQLALSLPAGYTMSSASGQFLTVSPVPEPATWALLLAGLATIRVGAGRRKAA